jgi:hypothetical protein
LYPVFLISYYRVSDSDREVGWCLEPKGNGVNPGGGSKGGPGPPSGEHDRQLTTSRGGDNSLMEHEEDGKRSQAIQRGPIVNRVRIINVFNVLYKCI